MRERERSHEEREKETGLFQSAQVNGRMTSPRIFVCEWICFQEEPGNVWS